MTFQWGLQCFKSW